MAARIASCALTSNHRAFGPSDAERTPSPAGPDDVADLWTEIEGQVSHPVVLLLEAGGAELGAVVGHPDGTVLTYRPANYGDTGIGSLHSTGPSRSKTILTAYYFSHHTEFPREWLVARNDGLRALRDFCVRPGTPPSTITWDID